MYTHLLRVAIHGNTDQHGNTEHLIMNTEGTAFGVMIPSEFTLAVGTDLSVAEKDGVLLWNDAAASTGQSWKNAEIVSAKNILKAPLTVVEKVFSKQAIPQALAV